MIRPTLPGRLLAWIALLLAGLLAGIGLAAYQWIRSERLARLDEALRQRTAVLAGDLRFWSAGPARGFFPAGPWPGPRSGTSPVGEGAAATDAREAPAPLPARPAEDGNRPAQSGTHVREAEVRVFRPGFAASLLFGEADVDDHYYAAWDSSGHQLLRSADAPGDLPRPEEPKAPGRPVMAERAGARECSYLSTRGERVLVGLPLAGHQAALRRSAWWIGGAAGGVLALGLGGSWFLARRALQPLDAIGAAADRIAAGNLAARIEVRDPRDELGHLAAVLNRTFARLETTLNEQRRFTADASHEMRTPLAVIIAEAQAALARPRSGGEYRATLETCLEAAQDMRRLVGALLDLARLESGVDAVPHATLDLAELAAAGAELVRPLAEPRQIQLERQLAPVLLAGDPARLRQVIVNLLDNAIHYNFDRGTVRITTRREGGWAVLEVADTGRGIAPEHQAHVFRRFYRADAARSRAANRTGLGLAIVQAVVEAHSGRITLASQLGLGTTVTIRLPVLADPPPPASSA
ncbi:MAG: HAMP domain-containing histidine kinase [Opitutaceae bacterium]|nr:HAMP domain-containing histidine kinase [Opitutaceae bacterium]